MRETPITEKQAAVLAFIVQYLKDNGAPPSVGKIAYKFRICYGSAKGHVSCLEGKGYLRRDDTRSRTITLTERAHENYQQEDQGKRQA